MSTEPNSTQIRSALDQLTYVKRILEGDQNLSLEDLLSSANAAQILTTNTKEEGDGMIPTGGLHGAVPALLEPLSKPNSMQFEPRKYLTLANSLARRFGSETKEAGQAGDAIELARGIARDHSTQLVNKTSILEQRKRRRQDGSLGLLSESTSNIPDTWDQSKKKGEGNTAMPRMSYKFPGQDSIPDILTKITDAPSVESALSVWKSTLSNIDAEAAASLSYSTQWLRSDLIRLRIDMDQVGTAILWASLHQGDTLKHPIQLQRINILAETEMQPDLTADNSLHLSAQSSFPLYRQLTAQILAKVLDNTSENDSWKILFSTLFALAGLCHLHDPFPNFPSNLSNQPCRGTVAVLGAFANWDIGGI
ncbi:uncharacterized protein FA14DRAFT_181258 [Meira miltonrushii]|uniref:Uncharacterized protein n=1 Tax=Meira miltonrushii TaxID=1280837 RepID=A0A316V5R0_9BASI|nr:uncharacterized protein FA14DRAFT_181258 [Meira miltonrushii]PWN32574.1 hypothetical protein FA14DRAFT_181258 [Meira miltonrushii]